MPTITRALTDFEKKVLQGEVNNIYADFTAKAALGRRMPVERLRRVASGRVWSGIEGKNIGLVDVLGDYDDALKIAAARAHLKADDYRVQRLPRQKNSLESLLSMFSGDDDDAKVTALKTELGPFYPAYAQYQQLVQMRGVQAKLPYALDLK